ncbi:hypothetical protein [Nannocystis pusilla]
MTSLMSRWASQVWLRRCSACDQNDSMTASHGKNVASRSTSRRAAGIAS